MTDNINIMAPTQGLEVHRETVDRFEILREASDEVNVENTLIVDVGFQNSGNINPHCFSCPDHGTLHANARKCNTGSAPPLLCSASRKHSQTQQVCHVFTSICPHVLVNRSGLGTPSSFRENVFSLTSLSMMLVTGF